MVDELSASDLLKLALVVEAQDAVSSVSPLLVSPTDSERITEIVVSLAASCLQRAVN
jgi:uncharacterized membrane protein affecting hemolysin expression